MRKSCFLFAIVFITFSGFVFTGCRTPPPPPQTPPSGLTMDEALRFAGSVSVSDLPVVRAIMTLQLGLEASTADYPNAMTISYALRYVHGARNIINSILFGEMDVSLGTILDNIHLWYRIELLLNR